MKPHVAVTLILSGVLVVAIPALWGAWYAYMISIILIRQPGTSVTFPDMPQLYQFGCWFLGAGMIATAVLSSLGRNTQDASERLAAGAGW